MFYTKYRPQTFSEISRPNEAADAIAKQISTGKSVHAYLFVGPRGTGKTSTARILAKALNCVSVLPNGDPCDDCDTCVSVKDGSLTDLIEIDAASNRGIDDIRDLQSKISLAPVQGRHKVYIIDEVHMLTPPAFNALLKTLEEPPHHVTFILCTTEFHKVPDTIKSRCQVFKFRRATLGQLSTKLKKIAEAENYVPEDGIIESIALSSLGGFRDAETLLQQVIEGGVAPGTFFNSMKNGTNAAFIEALAARDASKALTLLNEIYEEGLDLYVWAGTIISDFRTILLLKSGFTKEHFDLPSERLTTLTALSLATSFEWLVSSLNFLIDAHLKLKNSFIPQLPLEIAVINICKDFELLDDSKNDGGPSVSKGPSTAKGPSVSKGPSTDKKSSSAEKESSSSSNAASSKSKDAPSSSAKSAPESSKNASSTPYKSPSAAPDSFMKVRQMSEIPLSEVSGEAIVALSIIEEKWDELLLKLKDVNGPVMAMLKSTKPVDVKGRFIILEAYFAFHKERLESSKNRGILESALQEVFGEPLSITCSISTKKPAKLKEREVGVLTDVNVVPVDAGDVMNMLDGGLPL